MSENIADLALQRGLSAFRAGRLEEAERCYRAALQASPYHRLALRSLASLFITENRFGEAELVLSAAIEKFPHDAALFLLRGITFLERQDLPAAITQFDRAIATRPDYAEAWICRGDGLFAMGDSVGAITNYDRAATIDPRNYEWFYKRGCAQAQIHRTSAALDSFERALALKPDFFEALVRRANIHLACKRLPQAIADYSAALALQPNSAGVLYNRGTALKESRRLSEAMRDYDQAIAIEPDLPNLEGARLHAKMQMCDWVGFADARRAVLSKIEEQRSAAMPFVILPLSSTPHQQLACARLYTKNKYPQAITPLWDGQLYHHEKIRIAYLSGAFVDHPVSRVMLGIFENHDRARFEITGISYSPDDGSKIRQRLVAAFDTFIDVCAGDDIFAAQIVRSSEIDIAIDLDGITEVSRPGILAQRAAPIQVSYLGFPSTMGAAFVDYLIADRIVAPVSLHYQEKIVWMPRSFFPAGYAPELEKPPRRKDFGLPESGFIFCAFNNNYKITPDVFDIWMRLLREIEGSVLWLRQFNDAARENLLKEASVRGISGERLVFAPTVSSREGHLTRLQLADVFLDTLYYNAHSTGCDTLWCGVPIVSYLGPAFAGRVSASLLNAAGLPELVVGSLEEYEALALRLARDPEFLCAIRAKLASNQKCCPFFDIAQITADLERAYEIMHARRIAGRTPESFFVAPDPSNHD